MSTTCPDSHENPSPFDANTLLRAVPAEMPDEAVRGHVRDLFEARARFDAAITTAVVDEAPHPNPCGPGADTNCPGPGRNPMEVPTMLEPTPLPVPPLQAEMLVMLDHHWRCALTGEEDHPVALALFSRRHPDMPPILFSPMGLKATLEQQAQDALIILERCKHRYRDDQP